MEDNFVRRNKKEEDDEFPDQSLFEPDLKLENEPESQWGRVWFYLRLVIAGGVVVSLLYVSGVYQALLLTPTPQSINQDKLPLQTEEENINLSVQVVLVLSESSLGSSREEEDVYRLVENTSHIWNQANISLEVSDISKINVSESERISFISNPGKFISSFNQDSSDLTVFLTGTLQGLNGVAFSGGREIAVADRTSHYDFRTLAHEVGHLLGLAHVTDKTRLMSQGAYGITLTKTEIETARTYAQDIF